MINNNRILKLDKYVEIGVTTSTELSESIINSLDDDSKTVYIHLNCCNFYDLRKDINTLKFQQRSIKYLFEGIGMKSFAWLLSGNWLDDCNGTDSFPLFVNKANKTNYRLFLLGASVEVMLNAVMNLRKQYPNLKIAGYHSGYFDTEQENAIVKQINESKADILIIGRGMLKELQFIKNVHSELEVDKIWCVGGLFDFISHNKPRAPIWIRKIRLEWLFRILVEPNRFSKMFKAGLWTFFQLFKSKIKYGKIL